MALVHIFKNVKQVKKNIPLLILHITELNDADQCNDIYILRSDNI